MKGRRTGLGVALLFLCIGLAAPALEVSVRVLTTQLDDGDEWKRMEAARALGAMGPRASTAVPALIRTLKSRKPLTKPYIGGSFTFGDQAPTEARKALILIGATAAPSLTRALDDNDALTRVNAAWALWAITKETKLALPVLLKAWRDRALDEQDDCIRLDATAALSEIARDNPDLLLPIVLKALVEDVEMGYPATQILKSMGEKDKRAVKHLFELMSSDGEHLYRFAAFGLRDLKGAGVPLLIGGLKSDNAELRWRCAWALGGMKSDYAAPAVPALKVCQNDHDGNVRKWANWALDNIKTKFWDRYYP